MHIFLPYPDDPIAEEEGSALEKELTASGAQLPYWGKLWIRKGKVICAMPSHPFDQFNAPPVLFIDESFDSEQHIFFAGALAFKPLPAIVAVARYIQDLIVLAEARPEFWSSETTPPRLHLRELNNPAARLKTRWGHIPRRNIEALFSKLVPLIRDTAGLKLISPVQLNPLLKAISTFQDPQKQLKQTDRKSVV